MHVREAQQRIVRILQERFKLKWGLRSRGLWLGSQNFKSQEWSPVQLKFFLHTNAQKCEINRGDLENHFSRSGAAMWPPGSASVNRQPSGPAGPSAESPNCISGPDKWIWNRKVSAVKGAGFEAGNTV